MGAGKSQGQAGLGAAGMGRTRRAGREWPGARAGGPGEMGLEGEAASRQQCAVGAEAPAERILLLEKVRLAPARVSRTPRGKRREP